MMKMVATGVAAFVGMYPYGSSMALVQLCKYVFAVSVKRKRCCLSKNLLQLPGHAWYIHEGLLITASKGDTSVARLDCCKCR